MITENLSTLKIHKLTQEQYNRAREAGQLEENAIYLTPDDASDMGGFATEEYVDEKIAGLVLDNAQSDWEQTDESKPDFIKNKPEIPEAYTHPETHPAEMITGLDEFATIEYVDNKFADGSVDQVQADWDQVDASQPDYIANRPFGFGPDLLNNATLAFSLAGAGDTGITARDTIYCASVSTDGWGIDEGDVLTIMWDGEAKEYTAKSVTINEFVTLVVVGNAYIASLYAGAASEHIAENTYESFCIMPAANYFLTLSSASAHSVRINKTDEIKKIDIRYLPDEALLSPVQPDWNETDEDSMAFIKNKPEIPSVEGFATESYVDEKIREINVQGGAGGSVSWDDLEDKPFGEIVTETDILPLGRFADFALDSEFNLYARGETIPGTQLTVGEYYKVLWDGQEYTCEALNVSQMYGGLPIVAMGNGTAFGYPGNGEPFIVICNNDGGHLSLVCLTHTTEPCEYHDVRVYKESTIINKLDSKYLPEDAAGSTLPEVTTSDAGKFLRVSADGAWVAETILNAEEASF